MKAALFLFVPIAITVLVGCEVRLNATSKPNESVVVKVPDLAGGPSQSLNVSEMCYDKVVYLVNQKGGMSPKINPDRGGQFSLFVSC